MNVAGRSIDRWQAAFGLGLALVHLVVPVGGVVALGVGRVRFVGLFLYALVALLLFDAMLAVRYRYPARSPDGRDARRLLADWRTVATLLAVTVAAFALLGRGALAYALASATTATLLYRAVRTDDVAGTLVLLFALAATLLAARVFSVHYLASTFDTIKHTEVIATIARTGTVDQVERTRLGGFLLYHRLGATIVTVLSVASRPASGLLFVVAYPAAALATFAFIRRWGWDGRLALLAAVLLSVTPAFLEWGTKAHYQSLSFVYYTFAALSLSAMFEDRRLALAGVPVVVAWVNTHHFSVAIAITILTVPVLVNAFVSYETGHRPNELVAGFFGAVLLKWTVFTSWFQAPIRWITKYSPQARVADVKTPTESPSSPPTKAGTPPPTESSSTETAATATPTTESPSTETAATATPTTESPSTETAATATPTTEGPSPSPSPSEATTPTPTETPTSTPASTGASDGGGSWTGSLGGIRSTDIYTRVFESPRSALAASVPFLVDYLYMSGLLALSALGLVAYSRDLRRYAPLVLGGLVAAVFYFPNPAWLPLRGIAELERWDIMAAPFVAVLAAAGVLVLARHVGSDDAASGVSVRTLLVGVAVFALVFSMISAGFYAPRTSDFVGADRHDRQYLTVADVAAADWTLEHGSTSQPIHATSKLVRYLSITTEPMLYSGNQPSNYQVRRARTTDYRGSVQFERGLTVFQREAFRESAVKMDFDPAADYYPPGVVTTAPVSDETVEYDPWAVDLVYDGGETVVHWTNRSVTG